jgi:hypothetical protein
MGGMLIKPGFAYSCDGNDVITQLNKVFGDPDCDAYKYAQSHNKFGDVPKDGNENWKALRDAYKFAGVPVNPGWESYLEFLGTVQPQGPDNIYNIAQFRYNGLVDGTIMDTVIHVPKNGGHVRALRGTKAGVHGQVDSPCPMPQPPPLKY